MSSVTGRISVVRQPRGGYVPLSTMDIVEFCDHATLNPMENVPGQLIGLAVDYLTRFMTDERDVNNFEKVLDAFDISAYGAQIAEQIGIKNSMQIATDLMMGITGLDADSITNACKLVTYDVWYRNPIAGSVTKRSDEIEPDKATIENIRVFVERGLDFLKFYGPVKATEFSFAPPEQDDEAYERMLKEGHGTYGGFTSTVSAGDGDFLTKYGLWDFKVLKSEPTSKHTLQILMYWIMGQHSGQSIFKGVKRIGIFNPRVNRAYMRDIDDIPAEVIKAVETDVICYE